MESAAGRWGDGGGGVVVGGGGGGGAVDRSLPSIRRARHSRSHIINFPNKRHSAGLRAPLRSVPSWLLRVSKNREREALRCAWSQDGKHKRSRL